MKTNTNPAAPLMSRAAKELRITTWKQEAMDILIRAEGVELTDKLQEAVIRKIGRVRQYAPRSLRARVQLHKVGSRRSARQFRAQVHYESPGND